MVFLNNIAHRHERKYTKNNKSEWEAIGSVLVAYTWPPQNADPQTLRSIRRGARSTVAAPTPSKQESVLARY
jgi:hypothetical protein